MNTIQLFNRTIDYIEEMLDDEIDEKKVSQLSGYSYAMFGRIFSILAEFPLGEYIRNRKLTKAAIDIRNTDEKIIDIAMKYGYESSDSFTFAFKKFHRYTPSEVRNGKPFKVFSPIRLSLIIKGGESMKTRIEKKDGFKVAGVERNTTKDSNFNNIWKELFEKVNIDTLLSIGNGMCYGACYEHNTTESHADIGFKYMAGFDTKDIDRAKNLGLEVLEVPPAEYAIISIKGKIPESIHGAWKYVIEDFFPTQGYSHAGTPDFEVYQEEGDMYSDDYEMELWVPIQKNN